MKTTLNLFLLAIFVIVMSTDQAFTQITPSPKASQAAANRKAYLSGKLKLNYKEINNYEQALRTLQNKINVYNDSDLTYTERQQKVRETYAQFRNEIRQMFSAEQYHLWISDNHSSGTIRNMIEDFGMTTDQVSLYSSLCKEYRTNYNKTINTLIPKREKEELINKYADSFRSRLASSIGNEYAKIISDAFFINYSAYRLNKYYYFLSSKVATEYAKERYAMRTTLYNLKQQNGDKKTYLAEKERINDEYEAKLRQIIPADDYAKKVKMDNAYYDKFFIRTFNATPEQLRQYKSLMNETAIQKLMVRDTRSSKAVKSQKLQEINASMETKLAQILSADQMGKWLKLRGK